MTRIEIQEFNVKHFAFAENLRKYMQKQNKRSIDISRDLGYSRSSVSEWYNGKKVPRAVTVNALAEYLGCTPDDLFDYKEIK